MKSLTKLTDDRLLSELHALVRRERETTLDILLHLGEVDDRKLYLGLGYSSMFDYCRRRLRYCESASNRRIRTARCIRVYPEVMELLGKGRVSLTTVSLVAGILTHENKPDVLREIQDKSRFEVEAIVSRYRPGKPIPDRVVPVAVSRVRTHSTEATVFSERANADPTQALLADPDKCKESDRLRGGRELTTSDTKQMFKLYFAVGESFMRKLRQVQALLSSKYPKGADFETVFEDVLDEFLERHDPKRRDKRRKNKTKSERNRPRRYRGLVPSDVPSTAGKDDRPTLGKEVPPATETHNRHIPTRIRDEVFARDGGRCTYVGPDGERCGTTWNLQIDHIRPYGKGGDNAPENLRLLCAKHNRLEAERTYGRAVVRRLMLREASTVLYSCDRSRLEGLVLRDAWASGYHTAHLFIKSSGRKK